MKVKSHIYYYLTAIVLFVLFKFGYAHASVDALKFLISPTSKLVALFTYDHPVYVTGEGYFHQQLNVVIDKSCSGFNFWMICFLMTSFMASKYQFGKYIDFAKLPTSLFVSLLLTIFVNSARILFSIFFDNTLKIWAGQSPAWLHQAEGSFVYISFLTIIYLTFNVALKRITIPNA